jgi:hypothetical protein
VIRSLSSFEYSNTVEVSDVREVNSELERIFGNKLVQEDTSSNEGRFLNNSTRNHDDFYKVNCYNRLFNTVDDGENVTESINDSRASNHQQFYENQNWCNSDKFDNTFLSGEQSGDEIVAVFHHDSKCTSLLSFGIDVSASITLSSSDNCVLCNLASPQVLPKLKNRVLSENLFLKGVIILLSQSSGQLSVDMMAFLNEARLFRPVVVCYIGEAKISAHAQIGFTHCISGFSSEASLKLAHHAIINNMR